MSALVTVRGWCRGLWIRRQPGLTRLLPSRHPWERNLGNQAFSLLRLSIFARRLPGPQALGLRRLTTALPLYLPGPWPRRAKAGAWHPAIFMLQRPLGPQVAA